MFITLAILTFLSTGLALWQWGCGLRFPIHRRPNQPGAAVPVTVLKPLKGWDQQTRDSLESWLSQCYAAPVQILFGVDENDAGARAGLEELLAGWPEDRAKMVVCHPRLGPHPKVAKLVQLYPHASHGIIIISDADVWIPSDFLSATAPLLAKPGLGMVNCFYRQPHSKTLAMRWLSIAINADFWTQVLQSNSLKPQDFALGAVMMIRRRELEEIGGFSSYIDYLADDYQLGHRIARLGKRIQLSTLVVECRSAAFNWRQAWNHQLRQARTIRACHPVLFFFSIFNNVTLWCLLWLAASPGLASGLGVALAQFIRIATALHSEARLCRGRASPPWPWMVPIKDLLHFAVWAGAFLGNKIRWRGESFRIHSGGRLESMPSSRK